MRKIQILEAKMEQLKAVVYCRGNTQNELNLQYEELRTFAEKNGYRIVRTITEFGDLDDMTWRTLRLMARYREYDILFIDTLDVLNTSPENITEEIRYLSQNGISVVSIKDGTITIEKLPELFRKRFKVIKCKNIKIGGYTNESTEQY